jgi:syntaxin-binding protein 1
VFIAGGATYAESRACYEVSKKWNRDVILGATDMITPSSFIRDLSKSRDSRQDLKLAMDQVRAMPPPPQRMDPLQAPRPSAAASRMPSSQTVPSAMSSSAGGRNGAGGVGGPRPAPTSRGYSSGPASPTHVAHSPGHGAYPPTGSGHHKSSSKDSKEGDKKEKKKKKLGIF